MRVSAEKNDGKDDLIRIYGPKFFIDEEERLNVTPPYVNTFHPEVRVKYGKVAISCNPLDIDGWGRLWTNAGHGTTSVTRFLSSGLAKGCFRAWAALLREEKGGVWREILKTYLAQSLDKAGGRKGRARWF